MIDALAPDGKTTWSWEPPLTPKTWMWVGSRRVGQMASILAMANGDEAIYEWYDAHQDPQSPATPPVPGRPGT